MAKLRLQITKDFFDPSNQNSMRVTQKRKEPVYIHLREG